MSDACGPVLSQLYSPCTRTANRIMNIQLKCILSTRMSALMYVVLTDIEFSIFSIIRLILFVPSRRHDRAYIQMMAGVPCSCFMFTIAAQLSGLFEAIKWPS